MLDIGLEGMVTDDHTLISPVLSLGMLDLLGWARGFDLLRWAIRYSASFSRNFAPYDHVVELANHYCLVEGAAQTALQPHRIQTLRDRLLAAAPHERPELVALALANEHFSPATVIAAAAQVACAMYLMVDPVPHADYDAISREVAPIHLGNNLRLLQTALVYMAPGTQVLAALQAGNMLARGPSVLNAEFEFVPFVPGRPYPPRRGSVSSHRPFAG